MLGGMRKLIVVLAIATLISGCAASPADIAAEQAADDADMWAAMGYDGSPPAHSASDIGNAISAITERSNEILINGSSDEDCEPFLDAFKVLLFADFDDERQDYMAPLKNATSRVYSGCHDRGTWEGTIDDVIDISELGGEYTARF